MLSLWLTVFRDASRTQADLSEYTILFLGDIVGRPGRKIVSERLPMLISEHNPTFVVANGENCASGVGITQDIAEDLFKIGIDAITLGNHAFNRREVFEYLDGDRPIVRPANLPAAAPGKGVTVVEKNGVRLHVVNLCGRVYMTGYDDPFPAIDRILEELDSPNVLVDFHAEATSEKMAFGFHVDGRVSAVLGTHTHVTTADETVLERGTAFISDVGMCGPVPSVLGMDKDVILRRFLTSMPTRFEVAQQPGVISGVLIRVEGTTGRAKSITRIRYPDQR